MPALDIRRDDYDFVLARKMIAVWRQAAGLCLHGDYYPLTPFQRSAQRWVARQFDSPETGRGLLQAIRLPAAQQAELTVYPEAVRPEAHYLFVDSETGDVRHIDGEALTRDGFTIALPPRSGAIWFYQMVHNQGDYL